MKSLRRKRQPLKYRSLNIQMEMERYKRKMESYNGNGWVVKRRLLPVRLLDDVFLFANARAVKRIAASAKKKMFIA